MKAPAIPDVFFTGPGGCLAKELAPDRLAARSARDVFGFGFC